MTIAKVRPAIPKDIEALAKLLQRGHEKEVTHSIPIDVDRARYVLMLYIARQDRFAWVSESVQAALFGHLDSPWYAPDTRYATDLFFYAEGDGAGAIALVREFTRWAQDNGAHEVTMAISSGVANAQSIANLYERLGMPRVGTVHTRMLR